MHKCCWLVEHKTAVSLDPTFTRSARNGQSLAYSQNNGLVSSRCEWTSVGIDAITASMPTDLFTESLHALEHGPIYRFRDWPNPFVPQVAAGVYTIWNADQLIYVGMSGHGLSAVDISTHRVAAVRGKGLFSRLNSHASGRRSGDGFCIYVSDRLVLPTLSAGDIEQVGQGRLSLDARTRQYIHAHLSYRFVESPDGRTAQAIEAAVRRGALEVGRPFLNPL